MQSPLSTSDAFWQCPLPRAVNEAIRQGYFTDHAVNVGLSRRDLNPHVDYHDNHHAVTDTPLQFVVGCSGGRDSLLLLWLIQAWCVRYPQLGQVHAVHVHHGLSLQADGWASQFERYCQEWNIPYDVMRVQVKTGNVEQQARVARYQAFEVILKKISCVQVGLTPPILVLGHHQQDQAETVFMRFMQGSGVRGLSAMSMIDSRFFADQQDCAFIENKKAEHKNSDFKGSNAQDDDSQHHNLKHHDSKHHDSKPSYSIFRPLLNTARQAITDLCQTLGLVSVEDPANQQLNYTRVFLRQEIWSLCASRWAGFEANLARTAILMQDAEQILNEVTQQDLQHCSVNVGEDRRLSIAQLMALSVARQRRVIASWLQGNLVYAPPLSQVEVVRLEIMGASIDATPKMTWANLTCSRYQGYLYRQISPKITQFKSNAQSRDVMTQSTAPLNHALNNHAVNNSPTIITHDPNQVVLVKRGRAEYRRQTHVGLAVEKSVSADSALENKVEVVNPALGEDRQDVIFSQNKVVQVKSGEWSVVLQPKGLSLSLLDQPLRRVQRQGGERIHVVGRVGSWPLKKQLQSLQLPPWLRTQVELLYAGEVLLGVLTPKGFLQAETAPTSVEGWLPVYLGLLE